MSGIMPTGIHLVALLGVAVLSADASRQPQARGERHLPAFRSDRELASYFQRVNEEWRRRRAAIENCDGTARVSRSRGHAATQGVIQGQATDPARAPVPSAQVSISQLGIATTTDQAGHYRLVLVPESLTARRSLTVRVRAIGYSTYDHRLTVSRGDSVELDLQLCPAVAALDDVAMAQAQRATESITNVQEDGVDEGGIVKRHGDYLLILRRGRLFTVAINDDQLQPVAAVDAFGPDIEPRHTWYDELMVSGDKVVVIGYSYERGGTELGVFRITPSGELRHLDTYQLRSNDYYSSRNYASRLIGSRLIFYAPLYLPHDADNPLAALPAMRRWNPREGGGEFERVVAAQRVYFAAARGALAEATLHTVTTCDLAADDLACDATVVVGPSGRVFYVSRNAVYVWMSEWSNAGRSAALLSRMPLDGSPPSAIRVTGAPVDQFSFLESDDGYLNVLVRSEAWGDAMWAPEATAGNAALLRAPLSAFGDGRGAARNSWYRALPTPSGHTLHNRFVNQYLLYGTGTGWGRPSGQPATVYVVPINGDQVTGIALPHGVDRIEAMGSHAVVVGADSLDLHLRGIRLSSRPTVVQRFTLANASQGEVRSHGFFYRVDGTASGVLGLPIRGPGRPGYSHLFRGSAAVLFLRNRNDRFDSLGVLAAHADRAMRDGCKASCVDWYGNTRPLFVGQRIFALLGYELVEGGMRGDGIEEMRRVSFAPRAGATAPQ